MPTNQMDQSKSNLSGLTDKLLGPDYDYVKYIKAPSEMGMSSEGNFGVLADDIGGLISYVHLLVEGGGDASKVDGPMGTKFFLPTSMNCDDAATGKSVTRSIYINNVPDGSLPFISQGAGGASFASFRGLVPGVMSNLAQINPLQILQAFVNGPSPTCQAITMETRDTNNKIGQATAYVTNNDIAVMPNNWFTIRPRPDTNAQPPPSESFTTIKEASSLIEPKTLQLNYSTMPNDFFVKIYLSSLGLLGLYIFLKMVLRKRLR